MKNIIWKIKYSMNRMKANGTIIFVYIPLILLFCAVLFIGVVGVIKLISNVDWKNNSNEKSDNENKVVYSDSTTAETIASEVEDVRVSLYDTVINDDPNDESSNYESLKVNDPRCYHFKVSLSGADSIQLSYVVHYSDDTTDSDTFPLKHNGDSGCCWFEVVDKYDSDFDGTEKVDIYRDDTDEIIYTFSTKLYNDVRVDDYGNDGQIFPNSSEEYLSIDDVEALSSSELQEAINEIYARHGYKFNDESLTDYFSKYDWYNPTITSEDFSTSVFSNVERKNIELLSAYR